MSSRTQEHTIALPEKVNAVRIDIMDQLSSNVIWIDNVYALAIRTQTEKGMKKYAAYGGNEDYVDLMPNGKKGNYAFLYADNYSLRSDNPRHIGQFVSDEIKLDLIMFFNFNKVNPNDPDSFSEVEIIYQVQSAISDKNGLSLDFGNVYTEPDEVFRQVDISNIDQNLMRRPYGCFRMEILAKANDLFYRC